MQSAADWTIRSCPLTVLKQRMEDYKAVLRAVGKPDSDFEFPLMREVYCAETDAKAWKDRGLSIGVFPHWKRHAIATKTDAAWLASTLRWLVGET